MIIPIIFLEQFEPEYNTLVYGRLKFLPFLKIKKLHDVVFFALSNREKRN